MLTKIIIEFRSSKGLSYDFTAASVMHGVLMEIIDSDYADRLHCNGTRPFSQQLQYAENGGIWTLSALDSEAGDKLILPLMSTERLDIKYKNDVVLLCGKKISSITYEEFIREYYVPTDRITISFTGPAAFRSQKKYCNMPTPFLIIQSLQRRFAQSCSVEGAAREFEQEEIESCISVSDYRLRSTRFRLEGVVIPAFTGNMTLNVRGDEEFRSYINLLSAFAEYSGIGIKTALGMGGVVTRKE